MTDLLARIREAQIQAAEEAVIANTPAQLKEDLRKSNVEFAAKGGCPGCGSKLIAVHKLPCAVYISDIY